jgi:hypothetical protein
MTALLPRDLVVDIVASVRRLGGLGDCLTTTEQFFLAEELRTRPIASTVEPVHQRREKLMLISQNRILRSPTLQIRRYAEALLTRDSEAPPFVFCHLDDQATRRSARCRLIRCDPACQ